MEEVHIIKTKDSRNEKILKEKKIQFRGELNSQDLINLMKNKANKCVKVVIKIGKERNKTSKPKWINIHTKKEIR